MLHEAVSYYHELLCKDNLAEDSRALLDEGLERSKLIFGGRRLSPYLRPHFVSETDFARITAICETVWSAIQKVKDAAIADRSIIDELGLTEIERELIGTVVAQPQRQKQQQRGEPQTSAPLPKFVIHRGTL